MPLRPTDTTFMPQADMKPNLQNVPIPGRPGREVVQRFLGDDDTLRADALTKEGFNLREHLFYIKVRGFFSRTRQGSWTRAQVVRKIEQFQDEVKAELAARQERQHVELIHE